MKRSEMLQLLYKHFQGACYQDYAPDSEEVLKVIEAAGMLPPTRQVESWEELGIFSPNDNEKPRFKINKWDKE